jgi:hypothetical protein
MNVRKENSQMSYFITSFIFMDNIWWNGKYKKINGEKALKAKYETPSEGYTLGSY